MSDDKNILAKVQNYRKIVLIYEGLNREIDRLLTENEGGTESMSDDDLDRFHGLVRQRDELFNEMRSLEQQLLDDESMQVDEDIS
jgi:hypothetical protein